MGANRSYDMRIEGVPEYKRTHIETGHTIMGHKVLLQKTKYKQAKNILNSNSDSPIYLIGRIQKGGKIEIHSINIFENHKLKTEINLKYDLDGKFLAYNGEETHTHSHSWIMLENGIMNRKHPKLHEAIPNEFTKLIEKITEFNNTRSF